MKIKLTLLLALLFAGTHLFAHAIWIETNQKGATGKQHEVRIFFGEYAGNERDSVASWFSNLRDIQLYLTTPDGTKQQLQLQAVVDHYKALFTPGKEGTYILSVAHTVADVYGETKIEYYTTATVLVNSKDIKALTAATLLAVQPPAPGTSINKPASVLVYNNSALLSGAKVVIIAPGGWEKTIYTEASGSAAFTPVIPGRYMIEAIRTDKTPGTHGGKSYKTVTHMTTHCIDVNP